MSNANQNTAVRQESEAPVETAEMLGAQLLALLPALRLHSVSLFDAKGDVQGNNYVIYRWHDGAYAELDPQPWTHSRLTCVAAGREERPVQSRAGREEGAGRPHA